jgi:hypothetical protein
MACTTTIVTITTRNRTLYYYPSPLRVLVAVLFVWNGSCMISQACMRILTITKTQTRSAAEKGCRHVATAMHTHVLPTKIAIFNTIRRPEEGMVLHVKGSKSFDFTSRAGHEAACTNLRSTSLTASMPGRVAWVATLQMPPPDGRDVQTPIFHNQTEPKTCRAPPRPEALELNRPRNKATPQRPPNAPRTKHLRHTRSSSTFHQSSATVASVTPSSAMNQSKCSSTPAGVALVVAPP